MVRRSSRIKRYVGGAAGATLGYIVGNVPGAVAGYKVGKYLSRNSPLRLRGGVEPTPNLQRAIRMSKRKRTTSFDPSKRGSQWRGVSTGRYVGRFRKPTKKGLGGKSLETKTAIKGYTATQETYGRIDDPNVCYIAHSSINYGPMCQALVGCILKKVFHKAGIEIGNTLSPLPLSVNYGGTKWRLQWTIKNPVTNVMTTYDFDIPDNITFVQLVQSQFSGPPNMGNHIESWLKDETEDELVTVSISNITFNDPAAIYQIVGLIYLNDEYVKVYCRSNTKVQNRTKAENATGEDYSLERVDNQPLTGYLYSFKHAEPRLRNLDEYGGDPLYFNFMKTYGVELVRGSQFTNPALLKNPYEEPPKPSNWANIDKASKVVLQPGQIKSMFLKHTYSGNWVNVMRKIKGAARIVNSQNVYGRFGKSQMIALEELLRTQSTNKITLNYESEYFCGAMFTYTKKKSPSLTYFSTAQVNNVE